MAPAGASEDPDQPGLHRLELLIEQIHSVEAEQETLLAAESKAATEVGPEKAVSRQSRATRWRCC